MAAVGAGGLVFVAVIVGALALFLFLAFKVFAAIFLSAALEQLTFTGLAKAVLVCAAVAGLGVFLLVSAIPN